MPVSVIVCGVLNTVLSKDDRLGPSGRICLGDAIAQIAGQTTAGMPVSAMLLTVNRGRNAAVLQHLQGRAGLGVAPCESCA